MSFGAPDWLCIVPRYYVGLFTRLERVFFKSPKNWVQACSDSDQEEIGKKMPRCLPHHTMDHHTSVIINFQSKSNLFTPCNKLFRRGQETATLTWLYPLKMLRADLQQVGKPSISAPADSRIPISQSKQIITSALSTPNTDRKEKLTAIDNSDGHENTGAAADGTRQVGGDREEAENRSAECSRGRDNSLKLFIHRALAVSGHDLLKR